MHESGSAPHLACFRVGDSAISDRALNLKTDRDRIKEAMRLLKDYGLEGCPEPYGDHSIEEVHLRLLEEGVRFTGGVIYGRGGFHRYEVAPTGEVYFSEPHSSAPEITDQAAQLGLLVR